MPLDLLLAGIADIALFIGLPIWWRWYSGPSMAEEKWAFLKFYRLKDAAERRGERFPR